MVATLLLASCAPTAIEEEKKVAPPKEVETPKEVVVPKEVVAPKKGAEMVKWTGKKLDGTAVEKMIEKPRYGGQLVIPSDEAPVSFDTFFPQFEIAWPQFHTSESLIAANWFMGPQGTDEVEMTTGFLRSLASDVPHLAESWETSGNTLTYHIRQGVRFGLDPTSEASRMVDGREFTAEDVVASLRREWEKGVADGKSYAYLSDQENVANSIYVSPTDKWAVVIEVRPGTMGSMYEIMSRHQFMSPKEVIDKYGSWEADWENVVGTGPFILKDYVNGSSVTYAKNDNYWGHDPFFPENRLPYADSLKILIIPDLSTQMAALRTGKIAELADLLWEDAASLLQTNPELQSDSYSKFTKALHPRNDTPPFDDVRVRRALNMGVNKRAILEHFYDGQGELFVYPIMPAYKDMYTPLEELPESVQELYEYNPDKARQLLAEAGYPDGFKITLNLQSQDADLASIVKADWAKIGVDVTLDVKDRGTFTSMRGRKSYKQMIVYNLLNFNWFKMVNDLPRHHLNYTRHNEPWLEELHLAMAAAWPDEAEMKRLKKTQVVRANEAAYSIPLVAPNYVNVWQPWLKGVQGARIISYNQRQFPRYGWINQELKAEMGH